MSPNRSHDRLSSERKALVDRREPTPEIDATRFEPNTHAVVELAIRDLEDQALAHFPSGKFLANDAWL